MRYMFTQAQETSIINPTIHLSRIPKCTTQNRNVHISVLNGALWDMAYVHCGMCEIGLLLSSPPSAAYIRQWIGSALVQIMACHLTGGKPLSEPMLTYCQWDPEEQTSVKFECKYKTFHSWKCTLNVVCEMAAIFTRGDELTPCCFHRWPAIQWLVMLCPYRTWNCHSSSWTSIIISFPLELSMTVG